jgi:hypothetical protein
MLRENQFGHSILVGRPVPVNGLLALSPKILFREKSGFRQYPNQGRRIEGGGLCPTLSPFPEPLSAAAQRAFPHFLRPAS